MSIENEDDITGLKKVGNLVARTIRLMRNAAKPGVTTGELDAMARNYFESRGALSAPEITYNFPGATCISVNQEAAHGIPGDKTLQEGDLVNIDVSLELDGYFADSGQSFYIGAGFSDLQNLCSASNSILLESLSLARSGNPLNMIGWKIETEANNRGYNVIRNLSGHGTGRGLHEAPEGILNYFDPGDRRMLRQGMVLAIETFISNGASYVIESDDGWTLKTPDRSFVAQFEHTIIVTEENPIVVTA